MRVQIDVSALPLARLPGVVRRPEKIPPRRNPDIYLCGTFDVELARSRIPLEDIINVYTRIKSARLSMEVDDSCSRHASCGRRSPGVTPLSLLSDSRRACAYAIEDKRPRDITITWFSFSPSTIDRETGKISKKK